VAKTYYDTLGLTENASPDEIKKSFRTLAKKYHPDRNKGAKEAENKFKEISEAYDTLSDPKKKQQYDTMRRYGAFDPSTARRHAGGSATEDFDFRDFYNAGQSRSGGFTFRNSSFEGNIDIEDLLSSFFGGSAGPFGHQQTRRSRIQKGADIYSTLTVSFMDAVKGTVRLILLGDTGKKLKVKVPRGIRDGGKIRLTGQGQPGIHGGRNGDLIITVRVMADKQFERKGNDIFTHSTISFKDAILGCKVNVKTLTKTISLKVPPGTQPGTKMRLKGQGLSVSGVQGDQYVEIRVSIPTTLTDKQRKLLEEWEG